MRHGDISYLNSKGTRTRAYGGKFLEHEVQATARDLMAAGMLRAENHGYPIVGSVHDEIIAEVPENFGSLDEFTALICETDSWAKGCPIAAKGWRGKRYRK